MSKCQTNGESCDIDDVQVKPGVRICRQRADTEPSMTDTVAEVASRRSVRGRASKSRLVMEIYAMHLM